MKNGFLGWFNFTLRLMTGAPLLVAGFMKAVGPWQEFAAGIEAYHILPMKLIPYVAQGLPWIELWIGTFLCFGYGVRYAARAAAVLFAVFIGLHVWALQQHIDLASCGCFGALATFSPSQMIILNTIALFAAAALARRPDSPLAADNWIN